MSNSLRIALVAEGTTDAVVIEAALRALLPCPFILTLLQPESTEPRMGSGWGGVYRWCRQFAMRNARDFESDPVLEQFDVFIVHIDVDVSSCSYADLGTAVRDEAVALNFPLLPADCTCPPPDHCGRVLRNHVLAWAGIATLGMRSVFCLPSLSTSTWMAASILDDEDHRLANLECVLDAKSLLNQLPVSQRVRNSQGDYRRNMSNVETAWSTRVRPCCTQADTFSDELMSAYGCVLE
jgi:hypothetical protein